MLMSHLNRDPAFGPGPCVLHQVIEADRLVHVRMLELGVSPKRDASSQRPLDKAMIAALFPSPRPSRGAGAATSASATCPQGSMMTTLISKGQAKGHQKAPASQKVVEVKRPLVILPCLRGCAS